MRKIIAASIFILLVARIDAHSQEDDSWTELVRDAAATDQQVLPQASSDAPTASFSLSKTSGAAVLSVITGVLMTAALRLVKNADGLSAPYSYSLLSGALLVSLYDIVKRYFGADYGSTACWGALATTIAGGLVLTTID